MSAKTTGNAVPITKQMKYYDLKNNWRRVKPHLRDKKLNDILVRDFNKFTFGRWGVAFIPGFLPGDFESPHCWRGHRGRRPAFWSYVKSGACHWVVNFALRLAMLVMPERRWRIITSEKHSTVWDGDDTIFDFNYQAFGADANNCFEKAYGQELAPGKYLKVGFAPSDVGDEQEWNESDEAELSYCSMFFKCDRSSFLENVNAMLKAGPARAVESIIFWDARGEVEIGCPSHCADEVLRVVSELLETDGRAIIS